MGVVHCATDHLTGQTLALKQIKIQPQDLVSGPHRGPETNTFLHLALASLHHPNLRPARPRIYMG